MILTGTGIIDSRKFPSIPAEIVVGVATANPNKILYSTQDEGTSWNSYSGTLNSDGQIRDIAYGNGVYVAAGALLTVIDTTYYNLAYSSDGINWIATNPRSTSISLFRIEWNGSQFLAISNASNLYYTSSDGINWTEQLGISSLFSSFAVYSLTWWNNNWYIAGRDPSQTLGKLYRSTDGVSWTLAWDPPFRTLGALGGNDSILTIQLINSSNQPEAWWSTDGTTWTKGTTVNLQGTGQITSLVCKWAGSPINKFVLCGFIAGQTSTKLRSSTDGKNWVSVDTSSFLGTVNNGAGIGNLDWDGTNLWLSKQGNFITGYTGLLFKTSNFVNFTPSITTTTFSPSAASILTVATKP